MNHYLSAALEQFGEDDSIEAVVADDQEFIDHQNKVDAFVAKHEEVVTAFESLIGYKTAIEGLLNNNAYSIRTAQTVCVDALNLVKKSGGKAVFTSFESAGSDGNIRQQHEIALEGIVDRIRDMFDDTFQVFVLTLKHYHDIMNDLFMGANAKITKYKRRLENAGNEYVEKKRRFRDGEHHMSLLSLWYFFSNKNGPSKDIASDLAFDTEASNFILDAYPKQLTDNLKKASGILKSKKVRDSKSLGDFIKALEGLNNPDDFFDTKYIGEGILFDVRSISRSAGKAPSTITVDGKSYPKFSDICSFVKITESSSLVHGAVKFSAAILGIVNNIKAYEAGQEATLTTEEIGKLIEHGKDYIYGAEKYLDHVKEVQSVCEEITRSLDRKLFIDTNSDIDGLDKTVDYLFTFIKNHLISIQKPGSVELTRAIRGAKYCDYIARRMIYNAMPYI